MAPFVRRSGQKQAPESKQYLIGMDPQDIRRGLQIAHRRMLITELSLGMEKMALSAKRPSKRHTKSSSSISSESKNVHSKGSSIISTQSRQSNKSSEDRKETKPKMRRWRPTSSSGDPTRSPSTYELRSRDSIMSKDSFNSKKSADNTGSSKKPSSAKQDDDGSNNETTPRSQLSSHEKDNARNKQRWFNWYKYPQHHHSVRVPNYGQLERVVPSCMRQHTRYSYQPVKQNCKYTPWGSVSVSNRHSVRSTVLPHPRRPMSAPPTILRSTTSLGAKTNMEQDAYSVQELDNIDDPDLNGQFYYQHNGDSKSGDTTGRTQSGDDKVPHSARSDGTFEIIDDDDRGLNIQMSRRASENHSDNYFGNTINEEDEDEIKEDAKSDRNGENSAEDIPDEDENRNVKRSKSLRTSFSRDGGTPKLKSDSVVDGESDDSSTSKSSSKAMSVAETSDTGSKKDSYDDENKNSSPRSKKNRKGSRKSSVAETPRSLNGSPRSEKGGKSSRKSSVAETPRSVSDSPRSEKGGKGSRKSSVAETPKYLNTIPKFKNSLTKGSSDKDRSGDSYSSDEDHKSKSRVVDSVSSSDASEVEDDM